MKSVEQIAMEIVAREGGYVNDPDDPGGATKYGVTLGTMKRLKADLTGDGRVSVQDVKALTRAQARDIYVRHYFTKPGVDRLPDCLRASVFDMYVNSGSNAVRILQRLLNEMLYDLPSVARVEASLVVDGAIGPKTVAAAYEAARIAPGHLGDAYGIARRNWYYELADRRLSSRKYARRRDGGKGGWITRAEEFISPRFHLSDAEHRERVSSWG